MKNSFKIEDHLDKILKWWAEIDYARNKLKVRRDFTTADSALLRRAKSVDEVIFNCPAYFKLLDRLSTDSELSARDKEKVALIAGVLSHVRQNSKETLPKHLKALSAKSDSVGLRFKRLVQASDLNDIFKSTIRAIKLVGDEANVPHLAKSLFYWHEPYMKKQWAYDFY